MQLAAPAADRTLVQLLTRWTKSGTAGTPPVVVSLALLCALLCQHQGQITQSTQTAHLQLVAPQQSAC